MLFFFCASCGPCTRRRIPVLVSDVPHNNLHVVQEERIKMGLVFFCLAVFLSLLIDLVSILLDIIVLSIYFPGTASSTEKFSAVMAILNLAFRLAWVAVAVDVDGAQSLHCNFSGFIPSTFCTRIGWPGMTIRILDGLWDRSCRLSLPRLSLFSKTIVKTVENQASNLFEQ